MSKLTVDEKTGARRWLDEQGRLHRSDGAAIEHPNGDRLYYQHGKLHRDDGPAIDKVDGHREWRVEGLRHRADGPAFINANGDREWALHGKVHRIDGPAVEWVNGDREWFVDGLRHRDDGGPAVERLDGMKAWHRNGQLHRDGGLPAVEYPNGDREYRKEGLLHREEGPAFVRADVVGLDEFWLEGRQLTAADFIESIAQRRVKPREETREERRQKETAPENVASEDSVAGDPGFIAASVHSDDHVIRAEFNAAPWFAKACDEEIFELAAVDFCNDYPADNVAQHFYDQAGYEEVTRLFDYLGDHPRKMTNDAVGFECEVDKYQAFAWIKEHRPDLFEMAVERANEDLEAIEDLIAPAARSDSPSP